MYVAPATFCEGGCFITDTLNLPSNPLFDGIVYDEQKSMLDCLNARVREFAKGECLLREHEVVDRLGIILTGSVEASKLDMSGKRLVISRHGRGQAFGDVLSIRSERLSPVTVTALENVTALMIPVIRLLNPCQKHCISHERLIRNLLNSISEKYFELHDRMFCITRPTIRERIMCFLEDASGGAASSHCDSVFDIPFDREAMAEYLNVERSALSRELSEMKRDGLIDYHKNNFRLLKEMQDKQ